MPVSLVAIVRAGSQLEPGAWAGGRVALGAEEAVDRNWRAPCHSTAAKA